MEREEINTSTLTITGILSALLLFILIVGLQAFYYHLEESEQNRKWGSQGSEKLRSLVSEDQKLLNSYRVLDKTKMIVAIPIDRAMELVVRELEHANTELQSPQLNGAPKIPDSRAPEKTGVQP
jgi:hypothetical protein